MNIKYLREEQNLSQEKLAKEIGTSQRNIGRWENGENEPGVTFLIKLADYFKVSVDYLIGRDEEVCGARVNNSEEELRLIHNYRLLSEKEKNVVKSAVAAFLNKK